MESTKITGKGYTLDLIKQLTLSLDDSNKVAINQAYLFKDDPKMEMKFAQAEINKMFTILHEGLGEASFVETLSAQCFKDSLRIVFKQENLDLIKN